MTQMGVIVQFCKGLSIKDFRKLFSCLLMYMYVFYRLQASALVKYYNKPITLRVDKRDKPCI